MRKAFTNSSNETHRMRDEKLHTGDKRYQCSICQKAFVRSTQKKSHEEVHTGEKSFFYTLCQKRFTNKSNLNVHLQRNHIKEKNFACRFC